MYEIKSIFHSENACYHSLQLLLSSRLLSKTIYFNIQNYDFESLLNGCQIWSLISRTNVG